MRKRGTNRYQNKYHYPLGLKKETFLSVIWLTILLILLSAILWHYTRSQRLVSPIPRGYLPTIVKTVYAKEEENGIAEYIRKVFGDNYKDALRVAYCESKLNPKAVGDNGDSYGLYQINIRWHKIAPKFLLNYKINTQVAKQLFDESGWNLWSCKP